MKFSGIGGSELLLILVVGAIIAGPRHAAQGIIWLRQALQYLCRWLAKLREETTAAGSGLKVDLSGLDPLQSNPRHLVEEVVAEEMQLRIEAITTGFSSGVTQLEPRETPDFTTDLKKPVPESLKLFEPQLRALQTLHQQAPHEPGENKLSEGNNSSHPVNPTTTKPGPVNPIDNNAEVGNPTGSSAQTAPPEKQEPIVTPPQNQLSQIYGLYTRRNVAPSYAAMLSVSPIVWIMVTIVLVMVFGAAKLPETTCNVGESAEVLKEEFRDLAEDENFAVSVGPETSQVQAPTQAIPKPENPADQSIPHQDS